MTLDLQTVRSIRDVHADLWDALEPPVFLSRAWLLALEQTRSVGPGTGWDPIYLLATFDGGLAGAAVLWRKQHSFGEFVYDFAWAKAADLLKTPYYPKHVLTAPLTPATGRRLLVRPDLPSTVADQVRAALVDAVSCPPISASGCGIHALFVDDPREAAAFEERGFFVREAWQYHWINRGYASFDEFLSAFSSRRRLAVRRERRLVADAGVRVRAVDGSELTSAHLTALDRFYRTTCEAYGSPCYLEPGFFEQVVAARPSAVVAMLADTGPDTTVFAGAFNVVDQGVLYGRYWGADRYVPNLHFEVCQYALIELAIERGYRRIEPGAGGDHKYARGFEPVVTRSWHRLADVRLHRALAHHTEGERARVAEWVDELAERMDLRVSVPTPPSDAADEG